MMRVERDHMYLVFAGDHYYPMGGSKDFVGRFDESTLALISAGNGGHDWAEVVEFDGERMVIVAEVENGKVTVYPERMAHVVSAVPAHGAGGEGER